MKEAFYLIGCVIWIWSGIRIIPPIFDASVLDGIMVTCAFMVVVCHSVERGADALLERLS